MTMTMEKENRPTGRLIAVILIALLAAGALTYGWVTFISGPDADTATSGAVRTAAD